MQIKKKFSLALALVASTQAFGVDNPPSKTACTNSALSGASGNSGEFNYNQNSSNNGQPGICEYVALPIPSASLAVTALNEDYCDPSVSDCRTVAIHDISQVPRQNVNVTKYCPDFVNSAPDSGSYIFPIAPVTFTGQAGLGNADLLTAPPPVGPGGITINSSVPDTLFSRPGDAANAGPNPNISGGAVTFYYEAYPKGSADLVPDPQFPTNDNRGFGANQPSTGNYPVCTNAAGGTGGAHSFVSLMMRSHDAPTSGGSTCQGSACIGDEYLLVRKEFADVALNYSNLTFPARRVVHWNGGNWALDVSSPVSCAAVDPGVDPHSDGNAHNFLSHAISVFHLVDNGTQTNPIYIGYSVETAGRESASSGPSGYGGNAPRNLEILKDDQDQVVKWDQTCGGTVYSIVAVKYLNP